MAAWAAESEVARLTRAASAAFATRVTEVTATPLKASVIGFAI